MLSYELTGADVTGYSVSDEKPHKVAKEVARVIKDNVREFDFVDVTWSYFEDEYTAIVYIHR